MRKREERAGSERSDKAANLCVCTCVCVTERERQKERDRESYAVCM